VCTAGGTAGGSVELSVTVARERIGQGAKVPGSELARVLLADSPRGANWPGNEKARYHHNPNSYPNITLNLTIT